MYNSETAENIKYELNQPKLTDKKTFIEFSPGETSVLGLKIGRCNSDYFDEKEFYKQITDNDYDLCRLKVPAEDEYAPLRLNKTGLPAFFSGSIRRYKTRISENPPGKYNYLDLTWEPYDGTQNQLLRDMLVGTWGDYPIGYYRSPYSDALVTKEKEIEAVFQFYKKQNNPSINPGNGFMFIKHGENYVGFFALNIINGNLESHVGGILAPYRKGGYFLDKLRYIKEYCIKHQLPHFIFGARNENAEVQRIFQYVGFQAMGSENVFHIPALLTFSKLPPVEIEMILESNICRQLINEAFALSTNIFPEQNKISLQLNHPEMFRKGKRHTFKFSFPVVTDNEMLMVIRSTTREFAAFTGYLRVAKE